MSRRIRWLGLVLIVCFALVVVQLVNIQVSKGPSLAQSGSNPVNRVPNYLEENRGNVYAADGTLLATSVRIAPSGSGSYQFKRVYPTGALFSQIVGTYSPFYRSTGVEATYGSYLERHKRSAETLSQLLSPPGATTDDITLTVVPALQRAAVDALNGLPGPNRDGAIVMVDPRTGAVLAMASSPSYDPTPLTAPSYPEERAAWNAYHAQDAEGYAPIYPLATYNAIPPGSTAKVVTTAAIFNLDPVLASYDFPITRCLTNIPDTNQQICNDADTAAAATPCGGTIAAMLPESCDPGYAKLGLLLGADHLARQAELFGFNAVPPLDLPAGYVQPSRYPNARQLSPGGDPGVPGQAYSAFGQQDVATTALENVLVAAGIANGGAVMAPHFLAKVTDAQGHVVKRYRPHVWRQATSGAAAANVIPLMEAVATSPSGTASGVGFPPALHVAVKTGTAQVGYPSITSVADWMIGFAPATNPKVAIAVVVPSQPLSTAGATIAGPIVKTMLLAALAP